MDPLDAIRVAGVAVAVISRAVFIVDNILEVYKSTRFVLKNYGIMGICLLAFGSDDVLRYEFQVLASDDAQVAFDFKKATQDESNMIAVAGTIVAQIAITAFSLADPTQIDWTARGLFSFSLVSSLIAVYYASRQHRIMGRCLSAGQIRAWIVNEHEPSVLRHRFLARPSDEQLLRKPAVSSILTISAPAMLLSTSLNSLLAGFGVYLGLSWTKSSSDDANTADSRNVFLVYIIGLGVCYGIYALSAMMSQGQHTGKWGDLYDLLRQANAPPLTGADNEPEGPHHATERARACNASVHIQMGSLNPSAQGLLAQVLYEAATLREESAKADRRIADIYRELSQQMAPDTRPRRGRGAA